jgi:hypothetical protein
MVREQIEAGPPTGAEAIEQENAVVFYATQGKDPLRRDRKALGRL